MIDPVLAAASFNRTRCRNKDDTKLFSQTLCGAVRTLATMYMVEDCGTQYVSN